MEAQQTGVCVVATDHVYGMGVLQVKDMLHSASLRLALQLRANEKSWLRSQQLLNQLLK